jgi:hypothetical protein
MMQVLIAVDDSLSMTNMVAIARGLFPSRARVMQVLIAVDDSLSMTNMGAAPHALDALAMLWKALQQLEVNHTPSVHPKPYPPNPKPKTLKPKPQTPNPKP